MAVYTTIDDPEKYFQCKIYTGNATDDTAITLDGDSDMQPDWVWTKERSQTGNHNLFDSVRGISKRLRTNSTDGESTLDPVNQIKSFDSDGFTLGTNNGSNENLITFVAWAWKAGTSFSNDASATSVGTIDSSGSANDTAGFSIVSYTGTGSAGTIKHGLSTAPNWIIFKNRETDGQNWIVYHSATSSTPQDDFLKLNATSAVGSSTSYGNNTAPTTSVFSVGANDNTNKSSEGQIAYLFAQKQGFSKFGSYVGNAADAGPFIYTGFRPAWIMCKASSDSGEGWHILDNKRDIDNPVLTKLAANANSADSATAGDNNVDFLSNGFKIITNDNGLNKSDVTYIYMAFAEAPFVNSNGAPCNAR